MLGRLLMRKLIWLLIGGIMLLLIVITTTPLGRLLFPPPLSKNQRAILQRAEAGLNLYATKSVTAAGFAKEVREQSRWATSPMILPAPPDTGKGQAFIVSVMSSNPMRLLAFYLHPTRAVCFIEETCDSLGPLSLGLTYAHELQHRRNFRSGFVTSADFPNSEAARFDEARAKLIENTILNEYTEGRWAKAIDLYRRRYWKEPLKVRRRLAFGERLFLEDANGLRTEFGHMGATDHRELVGHFLFAAKFRQATINKKLSPADSLRIAASLLPKK